MPFSLYVALGDSMSTDHYPTCDVRDLDIPPSRLDPLGAASLLHRNDDVRWPEFKGHDLAAQSPGVEFRNLAEDGAMIDDVATEELARLGRVSHDPGILITLTAGGNDLLDALLARRPLESAVSRIAWRYAELIASVREELPRATVVLTTVYDPTDGTGLLPGLEAYGTLPLQYLDRFNQQVRETARATPGVLLADLHRDFLGHGVKATEQEQWYWRRNLIEPNARGASEVRRAWLKAVKHVNRETSKRET
jgi:lysophospholipase L1-like esterase